MTPINDDRTLSTEEMLAELHQDPAFGAAWKLEEPKVTLAANIARLRALRRMTQAQLAEAARTRQPRIAEIERGDANPKFETLIRIAHALGVGLDDLVRREEFSPRPATVTVRSAAQIVVYDRADISAWEATSGARTSRVTRRQRANDNFSLNA
ncbi:MAG TPA: helix-turn-helix transcriptional regulator [Longimicrobium sp.]|jgi:transcriptional regulator with XRE-family HTH domain